MQRVALMQSKWGRYFFASLSYLHVTIRKTSWTIAKILSRMVQNSEHIILKTHFQFSIVQCWNNIVQVQIKNTT